MRHQVSEPPIVLQGFLFLHILTFFKTLLKHSFEARPLGSSSLAIFVCAYRLGSVLDIVRRGLPLCKSHACETERIVCRGVPKLGQAAKRDTGWS